MRGSSTTLVPWTPEPPQRHIDVDLERLQRVRSAGGRDIGPRSMTRLKRPKPVNCTAAVGPTSDRSFSWADVRMVARGPDERSKLLPLGNFPNGMSFDDYPRTRPTDIMKVDVRSKLHGPDGPTSERSFMGRRGTRSGGLRGVFRSRCLRASIYFFPMLIFALSDNYARASGVIRRTGFLRRS